jgi:hypothetical protein
VVGCRRIWDRYPAPAFRPGGFVLDESSSWRGGASAAPDRDTGRRDSPVVLTARSTRVLCEGEAPPVRILCHGTPDPTLNWIEVVGAPDWEQLTRASLAYNLAGPTSRTLWDFRSGVFPGLDAARSRAVAERVEPHLRDAPERRVAMVAATAHEFGLLRMYASWAEATLTGRVAMAFAPFRDVDTALRWLAGDAR